MPKVKVGVQPGELSTLAEWEMEYWWRQTVMDEKREEMGGMNALPAVLIVVLVFWIPVLTFVGYLAS